MHVAANKVVSIEYTLTNAQGEVMDSSADREPMAYLQGHQNIIPGLESALEGKSVGDQLQVTIEPAEAYGERDESLRQAVPRTMFEDADNVQVGMQFQTVTDQGTQVVTVTQMDTEEVTIDANHPLAGETLTFDVTVVDIREPSPEELEHGHVHGPHDEHHH